MQVPGGSGMETRVAVISIIVEDQNQAETINQLLHAYSDSIIGRMGIPYKAKQVSVISVVLDDTPDHISTLAGKLGKLTGVSVKTAMSAV